MENTALKSMDEDVLGVRTRNNRQKMKHGYLHLLAGLLLLA